MSDVSEVLGLASILLAGASLAMRGSASREEACQIIPLDEDAAETVEQITGQDYYGFLDECDALFDRMGIRTSRDETLYEACVSTDKLLYGVTAVAEGAETTTFSIVVSETARKKGVATRLVESLLSRFLGEAEVRVWVVNPHMAKLLETRFGFETEGREWSEHEPHMTAPHDALQRLKAWREGSRSIGQRDLLLVRTAVSQVGFRPKAVMDAMVRGRAHDPHEVESVEVVVSAGSAGELDLRHNHKLLEFVHSEARKAGMKRTGQVAAMGTPQVGLHGRERRPGWRRSFRVTP